MSRRQLSVTEHPDGQEVSDSTGNAAEGVFLVSSIECSRQLLCAAGRIKRPFRIGR